MTTTALPTALPTADPPTTGPPMADRSVVRWGIIGVGDVTEAKSGPGFQQAHGSALVAVMRVPLFVAY